MAVRPEGTLKSPLSKHLSSSDTEALLGKTGARPGDLLLVSACSLDTVVGHQGPGARSAPAGSSGAGVSCRTRRREEGCWSQL